MTGAHLWLAVLRNLWSCFPWRAYDNPILGAKGTWQVRELRKSQEVRFLQGKIVWFDVKYFFVSSAFSHFRAFTRSILAFARFRILPAASVWPRHRFRMHSWRWWLFLVLPRMKCEIPGREKDIEGSLDSWLKGVVLPRLVLREAEMCHEGHFHVLIFVTSKDQLTKDASVIQEKVPWVKPWLGKNDSIKGNEGNMKLGLNGLNITKHEQSFGNQAGTSRCLCDLISKIDQWTSTWQVQTINERLHESLNEAMSFNDLMNRWAVWTSLVIAETKESKLKSLTLTCFFVKNICLLILRQFEYKGNRLPDELSEFSGTVSGLNGWMFTKISTGEWQQMPIKCEVVSNLHRAQDMGKVWIPQSSQQTIRKVHFTAKKVTLYGLIHWLPGHLNGVLGDLDFDIGHGAWAFSLNHLTWRSKSLRKEMVSGAKDLIRPLADCMLGGRWL